MRNPRSETEAFPYEQAPRFLVRDGDKKYGDAVELRIHNLGIQGMQTSPGSPWQNPFVERFIGSLRRECLNHVIVVRAALQIVTALRRLRDADALDAATIPAEPLPDDDTSSPSACLSCGESIPVGVDTCSKCGWSYRTPDDAG